MVNFNTIETLWVSSKSHKYPIYIGEQLLTKELFLSHIQSQKILIVTDNNVAPLYLASLKDKLSSCQVSTYIVPCGEENKSLDNWSKILAYMVEVDLNRDSLVIALGGGVIGDLAGFAASCFQRGVSFLQIPTTLLAQVDASIGGKTAINFCNEKNMVGSFYQPQAVFIDPLSLKTLSKREYIAGLAEVIKSSLLSDIKFFKWIDNNHVAILNQESNVLTQMIKKSCLQKASVVEQDEKEQGVRALLNLGHTFAHALESLTSYKRWLHGEAVAIGLYCQALLSNSLGYLGQVEVEQIRDVLIQFDLPYSIPSDISIDTLINLMYRDKKVLKSKLRFVILHSIGYARVQIIDDIKLVKRVLEQNISY